MKKWSLVVACLYALTLLVLCYPLAIAAFTPKSVKLSEFAEGLVHWQTWVLLGVMMVAQFALLRVPVAVAANRPKAQRSIWSTILAAAFMMGLLVLGGVASIYETLTKLKGSNGFGLAVACGVVSWVFWAFYFHRATSGSKAADDMTTIKRHLWTGSVIELLIAIPTHVVARHRDYCCAGIMTFLGLSCGFAVMIFAFGPALFYLFAARWRRLHPQLDSTTTT